jgi:hypothetical protein
MIIIIIIIVIYSYVQCFCCKEFYLVLTDGV